MVKEKTSLGGINESIKNSAFLQEGNRVSLGAFSKWSWNLVWHEGYAGKYFVIFLIMFGIGIVTGILDRILSAIIGLGSDPMTILSDIAGVIFAVGLLGVSINIAKGLEQKVKDFFHEITWDRIWKIICVSIAIVVVLILCFVPFIASIVPESGVNVALLILGIILILFGMFLGIKLNFAQYAVVDKGFGPKEALIYSRNITKGHFWEIVLFDLYFLAINILGMLCLLVGLIWTVPMTYTSTAKYYLVLSELYGNGSVGK